MSRFTVLVITQAVPTEDGLSAALQPFHEYECTGTNDQYVVDVDMTEEAMAAYSKATETRLKAPDGTLHSFFTSEGSWDRRFSEPDPEAPDWRRDQRREFVPPGYDKIKLPASEAEAACDWIKDYYGWPIAGEDSIEGYGHIQIDADRNVVKCIKRTNPNKKWDWWVVGGRWSGMLLNKDGEKVDQLSKGDLDLTTMRAISGEEAQDFWNKVASVVVETEDPEEWSLMRERMPIEEARNAYGEQPRIKAIRAAFPDAWDIKEHLSAASMSSEDFTARGERKALATFAFLKDGEWVDRREMGWWGCVSNEMDAEEWSKQFNNMIDSLPDDAGLTVVDCHI